LPLFPELSSHNSSLPPISRITTTLETILSPVQPEEPEEEEDQNFDIPLSKEEKPEAYPDGPICVYEPHIDLYLEPTAEQCRQYDVILNVASEVRNPLIEQVVADPEEPDIRIDGGGGIQYAPRRDRIPNKDEKELPHEASPTTPKATPLDETFAVVNGTASNKEPEYIHIKWEHNSDIVPDLLRLVKLIDEKAMLGQRVLVHCQCGVSRSASLVVAYGLYKNPALSVQEAYDAVKKRSKWIGPNMNLIMQLQEFRTSLMRGGLLSANRGLSPMTPDSAMSEWRGPFAMSPIEREGPLSAGASKHQQSEPMPVFSPGPSSAPSSMPWPSKETSQRGRSISAVKPGTAYVSPQGRIVPVVPVLNVVAPEYAAPKQPKKHALSLELKWKDSDANTPTDPLKSPLEEEFHLTPLQPSPDFDAADSFGIMSPTTSEFTTNPFDRSALLAQLGMGPVGRQEDPPRRSISLRSKAKPQPTEDTDTALSTSTSTAPKRIPRLRGKISSPSIREQQHLQSLQAQISASLPHRTAQSSSLDDNDDALMSPRATEFTQNPWDLALSIPSEQQQQQSQADAPHSADSDPRSPAQKGVSPITRNILDVL
jgi:tyrosine-protein phosphatase